MEESPGFSPDSAKSEACQFLRLFRPLWLQFRAFHQRQGCRRGSFSFLPVNPLAIGVKLLAFWDLPKIPQNRGGISRIFAKFREVLNVPTSATIPLPMAPVSCVPSMSGMPAGVVPLFSGQSPSYGREIAGVLGSAKNPAKSWRNLQDFRQIPRSPKRANFCDYSAPYGSSFVRSISVRDAGGGRSPFCRSIP